MVNWFDPPATEPEPKAPTFAPLLRAVKEAEEDYEFYPTSKRMVDVTIKAAGIPVSAVKEIADRFDAVRRCEYNSGEILSGRQPLRHRDDGLADDLYRSREAGRLACRTAD